MENSKCYLRHECRHYNRFCDPQANCQLDSCNNRNCCSNKKKEKITLEAWAHRCGIIFPCGYVKVTKGNDITFLVKAEEGYRIQDIMVDCERITDDHVVIECQEKYCLTLCHVTCGHRVEAYFVKK